MSTALAIHCEAVVDRRAGAFGFEPVTCTQSVGLTTLTDAAGITHHACTRWGHREQLVRRFGETILPDEHTHFDDRDANLVECPACERAEVLA